jgi:hypothetical protein
MPQPEPDVAARLAVALAATRLAAAETLRWFGRPDLAVEVIRDLDEAIARMVESPLQDELQVRRLKRRKLLLKDQIVWLQRQLEPDDRA